MSVSGKTEDIVENRKNRKRTALFFVLGCIWMLQGCALKEQFGDLLTEALKQDETKLKQDEEDTGEFVQPQKPEDTEQAKPVTISGETEAAPQLEAEDGEYAAYYAYRTLDDKIKPVYQTVLRTILEHGEKAELPTTDVDVLEEAYKAVCADNGGLFWMSGYVYTQYTRGGELIGMDFTPKYTMDYEERERIQQQIDASAQELLAGISITDSDYEKAKYVFEILVQNVDYDASSENNQNIISTFLNRATVCQGYACGTQYLLRLLGIESAIVNGNANGESHAWNLVKLDGEYYYMDTTWGNSRYLDSSEEMEKYVNYNYLAVTSEEISRTHRFENSFLLPECNSVQNSYFIRENRYFEQWDPQAVGALLTDTWSSGGGSMAVKFANGALFRQALEYFIMEQHIAEYCENISSVYYLEDAQLYVLTFHL